MLPSLDVGGAENYALRLIRHGGSKVHRWTVMYPQYGSGDMYQDFISLGAEMMEMRLGFFDPWALVKFRRYLAAMAFDVVCSFNGVFAGPPIAMARMASIPSRVVWHRRATPAYSPSPERRVYAWLATRLIDRCSTRILSNSAAALDNFHGGRWSADIRCSVIPNGVDANRFRPEAVAQSEARKRLSLPSVGALIGHVGRFDPAKNHQTMFEVIRAMAGTGTQFRFLFCGKGTDTPEFADLLRRHAIEAHCITLGLQPDMPCVYRSMDAFYFPSWTEGQPNALIEAMLSGIPFVASDIPGIRDSVPPWVVDRLVAPGSVEDAVRRLRVELARSEVDRKAVREWAKERFDLERNLSQALASILGELVAGAGRCRA